MRWILMNFRRLLWEVVRWIDRNAVRWKVHRMLCFRCIRCSGIFRFRLVSLWVFTRNVGASLVVRYARLSCFSSEWRLTLLSSI